MIHSETGLVRRRSLAVALAALFATAASFAAAPAALAGGKPAADLVLVVGATGRTGHRIVEQLVAKNYRVRALVRDAAKAKGVLPASVEVVIGDVRDPATLAPAVVGVKYLISAIGAGGMKPEPGNTSEEIDNLGNANLAAAAKKAHVSQFVLVSSMGTSIPAANPMEFMRPILLAKQKGEAALRSSGVPYTIVKPGGLLEDAGGKVGLVFAQGDTGMGRVPRADVATVCVEALGRKSALRKSLSIVSGTGAWPNDWDKEFAGIKADSN